MNETVKKCPCCPRGCDLSAPHCQRGAEYAKTGTVGEGGHDHIHAPRLRFEKKEQQLIMKYLHHATGIADRGGFTQDQAEEMFSVLTDRETDTLASLLEKLSDHWASIAPVKPFHGGRG